MEDRVSRLEGAYEQVDRRLSYLHQSVQSFREETRQSTESLREEIKQNREEARQSAESLRQEMNQNREEAQQSVESLRQEVNTRINLLLLLIGGIWATMLAGVFALMLKL